MWGKPEIKMYANLGRSPVHFSNETDRGALVEARKSIHEPAVAETGKYFLFITTFKIYRKSFRERRVIKQNTSCRCFHVSH